MSLFGHSSPIDKPVIGFLVLGAALSGLASHPTPIDKLTIRGLPMGEAISRFDTCTPRQEKNKATHRSGAFMMIAKTDAAIPKS